MSGIFASKAFRVVAIVAVIIAAIGFIGWRALQPKIRTATMAEVRAVLPKELLVALPSDLDAQERYTKLDDLILSVDLKETGGIQDSRNSAAQQYEAAQDFWKANPQLCEQIVAVLNSGPLEQIPHKIGDEGKAMANIQVMQFVWSSTASAKLYAQNHDFEACVRLLLMCAKFSDRLLNASGDFMNYITAVGFERATDDAIPKSVSYRGFPISSCRRLLSSLKPAPYPDTQLAYALLDDFQTSLLPMLPGDAAKAWGIDNASATLDSDSPKAIVGTYDAIETAKILGQVIFTSISNARKPFSDIDDSAGKTVREAANGLPKEVDPDMPEGFRKKLKDYEYRLYMNNTHNSIGRRFIRQVSLGDTAIPVSCLWRTARDSVRVLLASKLYRAEHGGKLPPTTSGFIPYLGAWPKDPFNGKPMIYNAAKEKVYSVGANLIDDGGDVSLDLRTSKDVGVSLK